LSGRRSIGLVVDDQHFLVGTASRSTWPETVKLPRAVATVPIIGTSAREPGANRPA
jgi:hypothetical protein